MNRSEYQYTYIIVCTHIDVKNSYVKQNYQTITNSFVSRKPSIWWTDRSVDSYCRCQCFVWKLHWHQQWYSSFNRTSHRSTGQVKFCRGSIFEVSIYARLWFVVSWGGGYLAILLRSIIFPIFVNYRHVGHLWNITFRFDRCGRNLAVKHLPIMNVI